VPAESTAGPLPPGSLVSAATACGGLAPTLLFVGDIPAVRFVCADDSYHTMRRAFRQTQRMQPLPDPNPFFRRVDELVCDSISRQACFGASRWQLDRRKTRRSAMLAS